jgi:hypothetical protein
MQELFTHWKEIAKLGDPYLRHALRSATGEELVGLQNAFSRCFSPRPEDAQVPASVLRQRSEADSRADNNTGRDLAVDREYFWSREIDRLGIPIAFCWTTDPAKLREKNDDGLPNHHCASAFPDEVWKQIAGKKLGDVRTIEYLGQTYVIVSYMDEPGPHLDTVITKNIEPEICVVDSCYIDLNS